MEERHMTTNTAEPYMQEDVRLRQDAQSIGLCFDKKEALSDEEIKYIFNYRGIHVEFTVVPDNDIGMFRELKDVRIGETRESFSFYAGDPDAVEYREICRSGIDAALSFLNSALTAQTKI